MLTRNKYVIRSHIFEKKFRELIYLFYEGLSARSMLIVLFIPTVGVSIIVW